MTSLSDHQIEEIVTSMVIGEEFWSLEEAIEFVKEEAEYHELTMSVDGSIIMVAHTGLEVYEESGTYRLRTMEPWEL